MEFLLKRNRTGRWYGDTNERTNQLNIQKEMVVHLASNDILARSHFSMNVYKNKKIKITVLYIFLVDVCGNRVELGRVSSVYNDSTSNDVVVDFMSSGCVLLLCRWLSINYT